ncbi:MAG: glycosyltransferase family 2 protein [Gemmataceae bacterium]
MSETTIILPVYNGAQFLKQSLESIVSQQYSNYEVLVCDDASKDNSVDIIMEFTNLPHVKMIRNESNRGLFFTLNRLVDEAKTPRIRMWSQDDVMLPDCLRVEDEFWKKHPEIGLCYSAYHSIGSDGQIERPAKTDHTPEIIEQWLADQISVYHGCMTGNIATTSFRRDAFYDVGAFRSESKYSGDFELNVRMAKKYLLGRQRVPVVQVRNHSGQLSRLSHSYINSVRESHEILNELLRRMPPEIAANAKFYRLRYHDVGVFHHFVRAVLQRRFGIAKDVMSFLVKNSQPVRCMWWWFWSRNRRYFMPPTLYYSPKGNRYQCICEDMN